MTFASWLGSIVGPLFTRALSAVGIGVVTYAGVDLALTAALDQVRAALGGLTAEIAGFLALAGLFDVVAILAGGMTAALTVQTLKRFTLVTGR